MSFTIIDMGSEGFKFSANVWNWKTMVEIIKTWDLISENKLRQMSYNATGVRVEAEEAHEIGERVRDEVLPKVPPGKRMFSDLSITDAPDDMTLFKDEDEQWKNYSVTHDWLKEFSDFCLQSKGFQVY